MQSKLLAHTCYLLRHVTRFKLDCIFSLSIFCFVSPHLKILKGVFFLLKKLQGLYVQLCQKINSTTSIWQQICLPFKNNCLPKKTSKKSVRILKSNVYCVTQGVLLFIFTLQKKWSFPSRISSVNVAKSAVFCGFGHIYWRNP